MKIFKNPRYYRTFSEGKKEKKAIITKILKPNGNDR